jgi:hypothetical protein
MAFRLKKGEHFTGRLVHQESGAEEVLVERGKRAEVVSRTVINAGSRNLDWVIELRRDTGDEVHPVEIIQHWSSLAGELPPVDRPADM